MQMNEKIKAELQNAIDARTNDQAGAFEFEASGGLKHFVSSTEETRGMYIITLTSKTTGTEFKVYMI